MSNSHHLHPSGRHNVRRNQRLHHDWRFWGAVILALVAMSVYMTSMSFSWFPPPQAQTAPSSGTGQ